MILNHYYNFLLFLVYGSAIIFSLYSCVDYPYYSILLPFNHPCLISLRELLLSTHILKSKEIISSKENAFKIGCPENMLSPYLFCNHLWPIFSTRNCHFNPFFDPQLPNTIFQFFFRSYNANCPKYCCAFSLFHSLICRYLQQVTSSIFFL